jgi:uncharacterized protein (DUF1919 family)
MKQKRAFHNKPHKTGKKGYRGKRKEWRRKQSSLQKENRTLGTHFMDVRDLICEKG